MFVFGALEAAPLTVLDMTRVRWLELPAGTHASLVFILLGATIATYLLNAYALRRVESSTVAVYVYVQPVIAVIAAWISAPSGADGPDPGGRAGHRRGGRAVERFGLRAAQE